MILETAAGTRAKEILQNNSTFADKQLCFEKYEESDRVTNSF
jgi:hypothetical protein